VAREQAGPNDGSQARETQQERGAERAQATGARKPGFFARTIERARSAVQRISLPALDWRTFAWGLLVIIVLAFIIRNWAPVRISFFGAYVDAPRALVFAIFFLLGVFAAWLWEFRGRHAVTEEASGEESVAEGDSSVEDIEAEPGDEDALTEDWEAELDSIDLNDESAI